LSEAGDFIFSTVYIQANLEDEIVKEALKTVSQFYAPLVIKVFCITS